MVVEESELVRALGELLGDFHPGLRIDWQLVGGDAGCIEEPCVVEEPEDHCHHVESHDITIDGDVVVRRAQGGDLVGFQHRVETGQHASLEQAEHQVRGGLEESPSSLPAWSWTMMLFEKSSNGHPVMLTLMSLCDASKSAIMDVQASPRPGSL